MIPRNQSHTLLYRAAIAASLLWPAAAMAAADGSTAPPEVSAQPDSEPVRVPVLRVLPGHESFLSSPDLSQDAWLNDPFTTLEGDMDSVVADLDVGDTEPPAEVTQPLIIERIDTMIEMLEKACKGGGAGGGQNPSRPANASTLRTGVDKRGPMRSPQQDGRKWAELTPKEREKILQSKTDGFPAGYDEILTDYFRKLSRAEATPSGESTDAAK
jgi:hypothetical protein